MADGGSDAARIVGDRIRDLRTRLGVTQQELGESAEIHFTNIGKIERGETNPGLVVLVRLAAALGVDPGTLIGGIGTESLPDKPRLVTIADLKAARERQVRN